MARDYNMEVTNTRKKRMGSNLMKEARTEGTMSGEGSMLVRFRSSLMAGMSMVDMSMADMST